MVGRSLEYLLCSLGRSLIFTFFADQVLGNSENGRLGNLVVDDEPTKTRLNQFLDPTINHPPFPLDQLQFGQAQQKADMIKALGGALPSELVVLAQERRQLERLEVMSKQKLGRICHDAAPVSSPRYVLADVIATWAFGRYG